MGFRRDGVATPSTYPAGDGSGNGLSRPPSQHEQLAVGLASLHPPASMTPATDEHLATGLVFSVPGPRCPTPRNVPDPTLRLRLLRAIRASASSAQANNGRQRGDFVLTTARCVHCRGALSHDRAVALRNRLPILSLVVSVLAVLLVIFEGACFGATLFRGYPLADCVGHNGLVLILAVLIAPVAFLVDCLWSRLHGGNWPWGSA